MAVTTTSSLDNSVRAQYHNRYIEGAKGRRLYDAYAAEMPMEAGENFLGTSYNVSFLHRIAPSETVISQTADVTPVAMSDSTASVTPTSFGGAVQFSELLKASTFTNFNDKVGGYYGQIGEALMASLELLAKKVALTGSWVNRAAARASLDAGTNVMTYALLLKDAMMLKNAKAPWFVDGNGNNPMAIAHSFVAKDLLAGASEPLLAVAQYQDKSYLVNGEIGMLAGVRLTFSPHAHVFFGAGAANGTDVDTTISAAVAAGDTTVTLTSVGSLAAGQHLTIGTQESSSTFYPTTERVEVVSVNSSTATIVGAGPNGGFMYDHAILSDCHADDDVFPVLYGGPNSLAKVFASNIHGPFGQVIDPEVTGLLKQFISIGYKFYGNYGLIANNRLLRREVASSIDA